MPKTAAQVANELSPRTSKNKKVAKADEEIVTGGLTEEVEMVEESSFKTGTPFDLVEGRANVDYWGPFAAYGFVTTPHGEYGIPFGKILRFVAKKEWDKKSGMEVIRNYPVYEDAPEALVDYVKPLVEAAS